ncbi:MAG: alcohol dehydrogenase catalytic domain-containing protein [Spirochaetota bacterium]|nr:MAG: alcohol dehydrogenase catalytic domain-containing protein [Spirochaetota bacterium]
MKAVIWNGAYNLTLKEVPKPSPSKGEVLIRTKAVGVCGTDLDIYEGRFKQAEPPLIIGHEGGGIVEELGADITDITIGERVIVECMIRCGHCEYCLEGRYGLCNNGGAMGMVGTEGEYAEYFVTPRKNCHTLPEEVSWPEAAFIDTLAGPIHALKGITSLNGKSVAVFGSGPAGLFFCKLSKLKGASKVYLMGTRQNRLQHGSSFGADLLIDVTNENAVETILNDTDGRGVHIAIEAAGTSNALNDSIAVLRKGGMLIIYGVFGEGPVPVTIQPIQLYELSINGSCGHDYPAAINLIKNHTIEVEALITHRFTLHELVNAFKSNLIKERREGYIKGVILL